LADADPAHPPIGVIGGSGLYSLFDGGRPLHVDTPYGAPSDPPLLAELAEHPVVFIPRHGHDHRFPPHRVPYRANLWALRATGVRQVLASSAVGALDPALRPGDLVVPDQLLDRTHNRAGTFYDDVAVHVPFADPYCPRGRAAVLATARQMSWEAVDGATLAVIDGPRFSTRAESRWLAGAGASLVGMTAMPEAALARELALCFTTVALVTDLDAGVATGEGVTQQQVYDVFGRSVARLRTLLGNVLAHLDGDRACPCPRALEGTAADQRNGAEANSATPSSKDTSARNPSSSSARRGQATT
jgi:5'-methylthioadenosine phosphorylase